jgi:hypothetical protein
MLKKLCCPEPYSATIHYREGLALKAPQPRSPYTQRLQDHGELLAIRTGQGVMEVNEYRLHAAECLCIADDVTDAQNKMLLIAMAQAWLRLAQQTEAELPLEPASASLG